MLKQLDASNYTELCLYECGREKCIPEKSFEYTVKTYPLFHFVLGGKGTYVLDGKSYELKKGSIFYIPPHVKPQYYPDKDEPWTYVWIGFGGTYAQSFLDALGISRESPIFTDNREMRLLPLFHALSEQYVAAGYLDVRCLGLTYQIFGEMVQIHAPKDAAALSVKESRVKEAKEFITNNYQFNITIQDIADSLSITPNYLANLFADTLGVSPKQYLTKYRMERAKELLLTGRYKIKEIGEMVGYKNQLHFSSEFKKCEKVSPLDWQRAQRRSGRLDAV